jgi:hypothetical protein
MVAYAGTTTLISDQYNDADFELDLERELLQCAMEDGALSEEAGVRTRRSGDFLASEATNTGEQGMPAPFQGNALTHIQGNHRKGMVCADRTKWLCPGHLRAAGEQDLLSCTFARYHLRVSGGRVGAVAAWQEGTGLNLSLACLEVFGRCDWWLPAVVPLWIRNLKN